MLVEEQSPSTRILSGASPPKPKRSWMEHPSREKVMIPPDKLKGVQIKAESIQSFGIAPKAAAILSQVVDSIQL
jgi:hypothetical protein